MPVLEINENERIVLDIALMNHRSDLMREWGKIRGEEGRNPVSRDNECEWLDRQAVITAELRDRVLKLTADGAETQITEAEAKRRTAVANMIIAELEAIERVNGGTAPTENTPEPRSAWHREHGWLPKTRSPILDEIDAFNRAVNVSWGIPRGRIDIDQDQIEPGTWTTLPDEFDVDAWPYEETDPEPTTAGIDTQATSDGKVRIDITVGGRTLTVDGHESLLEALSRLKRKF